MQMYNKILNVYNFFAAFMYIFHFQNEAQTCRNSNNDVALYATDLGAPHFFV